MYQEECKRPHPAEGFCFKKQEMLRFLSFEIRQSYTLDKSTAYHWHVYRDHQAVTLRLSCHKESTDPSRGCLEPQGSGKTEWWASQSELQWEYLYETF